MPRKEVKYNTQGDPEPEKKSEKVVFRLFIAGLSPNSVRAVINIKAICEKYLKGQHELEIIDIYQMPELALSEDIVVVPLLIKKFPLPVEKMIGDLSQTEKVLKILRLGNKDLRT
jgi:circadian clock protein KaiB